MEARLVRDGEESEGRVIDLNNAGAFIATELVAERGERLEVRLLVSEGEVVPLPAVVARRSEAVTGKSREVPGGLGLVFVAESLRERAFIQKAVLEALESGMKAKKAGGSA